MDDNEAGDTTMAKMLLSDFHRRYDAIQAEYSGRTLSHREVLERRCRCEMHRKIGGIHFWRLWRIRVSFCIARQR